MTRAAAPIPCVHPAIPLFSSRCGQTTLEGVARDLPPTSKDDGRSVGDQESAIR